MTADLPVTADEQETTVTDFLADLRAANVSRYEAWHKPGTEPWTGADLSNAMCGEAGETANVVKKLRRHDTGVANVGDPTVEVLTDALADEIADTAIYLDLLAHHYGIDLRQAIARKFNAVSHRYGFAERLPS